jgi:glycerol-3-phosphate dehydrogenase subunit B
MLDLLVIGAGLAGLAAALRAAEAGLRVKVIAKGMGSLYWASGAIDLLGYVGVADRAVDNPWERMAELDAGHPFRRLGEARIRQALTWFQQSAAAQELGYTAASDENVLTPSPAGAWRPSYLAPAGQRAGAAAMPARW